MQPSIVRSLLLVSLLAFLSLPAVGDEVGARVELDPGVTYLLSTPHTVELSRTAAGPGPTTLARDDRDEPISVLALVGPAAAIIALTVLGLTLTIRELRRDLRQRRIVYRPRGPAVPVDAG